MWFSDHVRTMLAGVDPDQPWYFSESMFPDSNSNCVFPGRKAIRKDGCVWSPAPSPLCTPATIISPDNCAWSAAPDKDGGANPRPPGQVWNGGNWGLIISRGLMARVTPDQWLDCVTCAPDFHGCYGGGDCRVGECLWRHGVAPTLPDHDYGAAGGQRMGTGSLVVDSYTSFLENVSAAGGGCDGACRLEVERPLTANIEGGEPQMRRLERAYAAVVDGPAGLRREWRAAGGG